ncbi:MAG TPA: YitT family protein [Thermoanaerobaculia bacterium]|nr:YitT family protein [Thermoanaerobaculia bacterium]HUM29610.1 YitT family protein [Thermoanaerobaculia bacterium]HXK67261.1 YitT family protein [Thermoanaerobaculia bacterium]
MTLFSEKPLTRAWLVSYLYILRGALIASAGYAFFYVPHKIIPGGIVGISVILHHTLSTPVGVMIFLLNLPLFLWGIRELGKKFGAKTLVGIFLTSLFTDLFLYLTNGITITDNILIASILGAILAGTGLASIFRAKATTGGADILAQILNKRYKISIGQFLIGANIVVIGVGTFVFDSLELGVYSIIATYVSGRVIDTILEGTSYFKGVIIISDNYEEIKDKLVYSMKAGGSYLLGKGMYNDDDKRIIFTVVNRRGLAFLNDYIRDIDPTSFIAVFDAQQVYGMPFRKLGDE